MRSSNDSTAPRSTPHTKWTANSMIAGAGGGLVASIATCPLDVVKTKLQAQRAVVGQQGYLGVLGTVKDVFTSHGLRGFYRGLGPTILGYLPTWAIYFAVYDGIKTAFGAPPTGFPLKPPPSERLYPAAQVKGYQPVVREHPWSLHILSAMTAGAASTICTNPLWVIKTRFMTQRKGEVRYRHTLDAALTIWRTEGVRAFYRGLVPSLLGILHVAVQFPLYEQLKIAFQQDPQTPLSNRTILLCSAISKMTASIATYPHEVIRTRLQTTRRPLADLLVSSDGMVRTGDALGEARLGGEGKLVGEGSTAASRSGAGVAGANGEGSRFEGRSAGEEGRASDDARRRAKVGIVRTTKGLVAREGWTGLYKGLSINLLRTVPNSAVTMLTYELLMRHLNARTSS